MRTALGVHRPKGLESSRKTSNTTHTPVRVGGNRTLASMFKFFVGDAVRSPIVTMYVFFP